MLYPHTMDTKIAIVVGSLRKESFSRKLAKAVMALSPPSLAFQIVEIGELALYNEDLEPAAPDTWRDFRAQVKACDGVLFITPEYNRSVPGVLKNAIDVGSRPYGQSVWSKKPCAVISSSPGAMGGFGANHHLRQALVFLDMPILQQPEAYIGNVAKLFDDKGELVVDGTREFLKKFIAAFEAWLRKNLSTSLP